MHYPYVPLPQRKPLKWPNGKRVAVIITFNLETWDLTKDSEAPYYAGGPAILPAPLAANIPDIPNYSWREYGQRVGLWRMFDAMDAANVKPSCTTNAVTIERRTAMIDAAIDRGCEILAHNYEQGELLTDYAHEPEKERTVIRRTLDAYENHVGRKAKGWLSSSLRGTANTASILAAEGLSFYTDIMNDDQPFMINTDNGPIVGIPYSNEINDFTFINRRGHTTDEVSAIFREELSVLYEEGAETGRIMNIGLHPHVSGRAYRIRALKEFLDYATSLEDIWWATREEIADWYAQNHESHFGGQLEN